MMKLGDSPRQFIEFGAVSEDNNYGSFILAVLQFRLLH